MKLKLQLATILIHYMQIRSCWLQRVETYCVNTIRDARIGTYVCRVDDSNSTRFSQLLFYDLHQCRNLHISLPRVHIERNTRLESTLSSKN